MAAADAALGISPLVFSEHGELPRCRINAFRKLLRDPRITPQPWWDRWRHGFSSRLMVLVPPFAMAQAYSFQARRDSFKRPGAAASTDRDPNRSLPRRSASSFAMADLIKSDT